MHTTDYPISVLIPAYNAERYVAESVSSVLAQTLPPAEVIVFDDGSTDGTHAVLKTFGDRIRVLGPERLGFVGARNHLLAHGRHPWIAFHDADDIWTSDKLEKQVAWLQANPDYDGCLGLAEQFLEPGCTPPPTFRIALLEERSAQFFIPNLLTSRAVFGRVGQFALLHDITGTGSDSDWFARAVDAAIRIGVVQEVLYKRRWHDTNHSYQFAFKNNMLDILRRSVQRKRQAK